MGRTRSSGTCPGCSRLSADESQLAPAGDSVLVSGRRQGDRGDERRVPRRPYAQGGRGPRAGARWERRPEALLTDGEEPKSQLPQRRKEPEREERAAHERARRQPRHHAPRSTSSARSLPRPAARSTRRSSGGLEPPANPVPSLPNRKLTSWICPISPGLPSARIRRKTRLGFASLSPQLALTGPYELAAPVAPVSFANYVWPAARTWLNARFGLRGRSSARHALPHR